MYPKEAAVRTQLVRRDFLAASTALVGALAAGPLLSQQPPATAPAGVVKGPTVWLDMDQAALDAAYDLIKYAPNLPQITKRYATNSEAVRSRLGAPQHFAFGSTAIEGLDIYATRQPKAPVNAFIHGGGWRLGIARDNAFAAELFVKAGAHFVVADFASAQDVSGSLMTVADQVRRAVAWVYRNAESFGGDPNRLYVSSHSSGAHLAGVVLTTDWRKEFNLPADTVKGGLLCSGLFDLKPVRLATRFAYVTFTDEIEQALSPPTPP